jgi:hypothetical protein
VSFSTAVANTPEIAARYGFAEDEMGIAMIMGSGGFFPKKVIKLKPDSTGYTERSIQQFTADNAMMQHQHMLITAQIDTAFESMSVASDRLSDAEWLVDESATKGSLIVLIDWTDAAGAAAAEQLISKVARRHHGQWPYPYEPVSNIHRIFHHTFQTQCFISSCRYQTSSLHRYPLTSTKCR